MFICVKQKNKLHNSAKPMIFASEDIYISGTINTYHQLRKNNNSFLYSLTMTHKVFFQISQWFPNNIQILLYKYQKITFKSFQRVVYSINSSWKYSKKNFSQVFLTIGLFWFVFTSTSLFDKGAIIQPSHLHFTNEKKKNRNNYNTSYKMSFCTCTHLYL